jgi:thioredoxin domain-containing protein 5
MMKVALIVLSFAVLGNVMGSEESAVVDLTDENFKSTTAEGFWLVEYFAPWCGHCKRLMPTWEHLAKELKGKFNIAKVDCTSQKQTCADFGVKGFPTIKLVENGKEKEPYQGARSASAFVKFLKEKAGLAEDVVVADLPQEAPPKKEEKPAEPEGPTDVVILGDEDFAEKTKEGNWFVKFYAPWCGHCKRLAPTWDELATKINLNANAGVKIAKVDCTKSTTVCSAQGVRGYPTLTLLKAGSEPTPYRGGRDAASLQSFLDENITPAEAPAAAEVVAEAAPEAAHGHQEL